MNIDDEKYSNFVFSYKTVNHHCDTSWQLFNKLYSVNTKNSTINFVFIILLLSAVVSLGY